MIFHYFSKVIMSIIFFDANFTPRKSINST